MKKLIFPFKNIVSIDLGTYETKILEGKMTKKGIVIGKHFSILTPEKSYEDGYIKDNELISYTIKEELKKNKILSNIGYISIKSSSIITREVLLPSIKKEEIKGIFNFQLEEYLPIDIKDYVVQYKIVGEVEDKGVLKLRILLIAVPSKIIEMHLLLLKNIELKPIVLDFQSNSVSKLLNYNSLINGQYKINDITFAVIDLGFYNTNLTITQNGVLKISRIIEMGSKDIDKKILDFFEYTQVELEESKRNIFDINRLDSECLEYNKLVNIIKTDLEKIADKIDLIFKYYNSRELKNNIQMILLYGGLSNVEGIDNFFSNYFSIPTIKLETVDNVFGNVDFLKYTNCVGGLIRNGQEQ